ncbi:Pantoate-beta-alanine ligase [Fomitiporia mediterranea MF3/22]|uniref:Pantoate-beta-alanine ligase n=1 Tax=Fomitiporia mediterranea (strain MF3/22) TaxID=694068 RepID=UPI0004407F35|nr:Pantoate-beta-alanine ligase [Fomitiporia mediterranea MF3/22]EJC99950.1 Pantoate-beta-alanine ligase [Fomitiporia mediterranea MF3/22]
MTSSSHSNNGLPETSIPILQTLEKLRAWRNEAFSKGKSVGFVPTMGALHEGHLSLVRRSLAENDLTIVSIFVNPTQFAPHEDLASYPRTLPQDLQALSALHSPPPSSRTTAAVFLPSVEVMYPPSPSSSSSEKGGNPLAASTLVDLPSLSTHLEGRTRPHFFRGVCTVVTKLFNAVQPSHAYFGQKDIQQALILRRMVRDLLCAYPGEEGLHIVPTAREPEEEEDEKERERERERMDGLALSSRNSYLTPQERKYAPALYKALRAGEIAWNTGSTKDTVIHSAHSFLHSEAERAKREDGVDLRVDYVEMNDPWTFDVVDGSETKTKSSDDGEDVWILSGAMWVGRTRLIDNVLLGNSSKILY